MHQQTLSTTTSTTPSLSLSPLKAWRNALAIVLLLWLLLGVLDFGFAANYLASIMPHNLLLASFYLDLCFAFSMIIIVACIILWQRQHGETLRDLGWGKPTTWYAIVIAIIYGLLWTFVSYIREPQPLHSFLTITWERPIMMIIGLFLAFGEELAMRGFFMEQLRRGNIPTWLQVLATAIFMGSYHGLIGFHYSVFYGISSAILFGIVAIIFVIGKRSLTPGTLAHAMTHFLGDPVLTMGILQGVIALGVIH
jgi:membrane protease YdiL (CAAX protease family)